MAVDGKRAANGSVVKKPGDSATYEIFQVFPTLDTKNLSTLKSAMVKDTFPSDSQLIYDSAEVYTASNNGTKKTNVTSKWTITKVSDGVTFQPKTLTDAQGPFVFVVKCHVSKFAQTQTNVINKSSTTINGLAKNGSQVSIDIERPDPVPSKDTAVGAYKTLKSKPSLENIGVGSEFTYRFAIRNDPAHNGGKGDLIIDSINDTKISTVSNYLVDVDGPGIKTQADHDNFMKNFASSKVKRLPSGYTVFFEAPYKITQEDLDNKEVHNIFTVKGHYEDGTTAEDSDEHTEKIPDEYSFIVDKQQTSFNGDVNDKSVVLSKDQFKVGNKINYAAKITNNGRKNITIGDAVDSLGGNFNFGNVSKTLKSGDSITGTYAYTITQEDVNRGYIRNVVTVNKPWNESEEPVRDEVISRGSNELKITKSVANFDQLSDETKQQTFQVHVDINDPGVISSTGKAVVPNARDTLSKGNTITSDTENSSSEENNDNQETKEEVLEEVENESNNVDENGDSGDSAVDSNSVAVEFDDVNETGNHDTADDSSDNFVDSVGSSESLTTDQLKYFNTFFPSDSTYGAQEEVLDSIGITALATGDEANVVISPYKIYNEDGTVASEGTYNSLENNDFNITAKQTIVIDKIPTGAKYTISEKNLPEYWTPKQATYNGTISLVNENEVTVTNNYTPIVTGDQQINIGVEKHFDIYGNVLFDKDFSFKFGLYEEGNDAPISTTTMSFSVNKNNTMNFPDGILYSDGGSASFDHVTIKQEDITLGAQKKYIIREIPSDDYPGMIYEKGRVEKIYTAKDMGNGRVEYELTSNVYVDADGNEDEDRYLMQNTYYRYNASLEFNKKFIFDGFNGDHKNVVATFDLKAENNDTPIDTQTINVKLRKDDNGNNIYEAGPIVFNVDFNKGDIGKTFNYTVSERANTNPDYDANNNIGYDTTVHHVKIEITADANGVPTANVTYDDGQEFTNKWTDLGRNVRFHDTGGNGVGLAGMAIASLALVAVALKIRKYRMS